MPSGLTACFFLPFCQQGAQGIGIFITAADGCLQPAAGSGNMAGDALPVVIEPCQIVLRFGMALFRRDFKPVGGRLEIGFDALSVIIQFAQCGGGIFVMEFGGFQIKFSGAVVIHCCPYAVMACFGIAEGLFRFLEEQGGFSDLFILLGVVQRGIAEQLLAVAQPSVAARW